MDRTERFQKYLQLLRRKGVVRREEFLENLEISRATFKRDLEYMRDRMAAPVNYDPEAGGYRLAADTGPGGRVELPGLWFNSEEVQALLTLDALLSSLQPGLLGEALAPIRERIQRLVDAGDHSMDELRTRIRLIAQGARQLAPASFKGVAQATLERRRLRLDYFARGQGERSTREVSPQRLVHYRENWYLEGWCHLRQGLRVFALDAIESAQLLDEPAQDVPLDQLDRELSGSYGIFSGQPVNTARLRFTAARARWVANERWHPGQHGAFAPDGSYVLEVPYADDRELVMDILKHGAEVQVLGPPGLQARVRQELQAALAAAP